jgi:hypothetical protein
MTQYLLVDNLTNSPGHVDTSLLLLVGAMAQKHIKKAVWNKFYYYFFLSIHLLCTLRLLLGEHIHKHIKFGHQLAKFSV